MPSILTYTLSITAAALFVSLPFLIPSNTQVPGIQVAFIGNSVMFTNDLPRFMEAISAHTIKQNSCLNPYSTISSSWFNGNGMYGKFTTADALIKRTIVTSNHIYDYGACSTIQLLEGSDERLAQNGDFDHQNDNPCLQDENYLYYALHYTQKRQWDFVVINDATRNPARSSTREAALYALEQLYVPYFLDSTTTIPVLISTFAYWNEEYRDMGGLVDIPTFTSLTHEGYREFAALLNQYLPTEQQARIAPVGIAFLLVWQDNIGMWRKLFHKDKVHLSPHGTYLMGCVLYYTLYGKMPKASVALPPAISTLFKRARRMESPIHQAMPMPTREEAAYLFDICKRVMALGHVPASFIHYHNNETVDYEEDEPEEGRDFYKDESAYYRVNYQMDDDDTFQANDDEFEGQDDDI